MSLTQDELLATEEHSPLPTYQEILVGVDASDHANQGIKDAIDIGNLFAATVTGAHVYAAQMHDRRFRQMEGGLPEQFKEETELEKQRDIHDSLITNGLSVITDSYLDQVDIQCQRSNLNYRRRSLEGKNYRELVREANSGRYDLLIMGSRGLGAVQSSRIGTVCERVCRRSDIDTLIIKNPDRSLRDGPILVAVDGSARAYGGLLTGLSLAIRWQLPLHVISAYDPYYHYVAFNRIAEVLSEEAGKIFRFKEQEKLHEDIIDSGLAKIYQGHLDVSESIASEYQVEISTTLLDGKPHEAISNHVAVIDPSVLIVGKLGIHADAELDIGGQAENLLRSVNCAMLLSQRSFTPKTELLAKASTSWTHQAEQRMEKVPEFVRGMARLAVLRFAQEQGHTVITESIVEQATESLCPVSKAGSDSVAATQHDADQEDSFADGIWSQKALALLNSVTEGTERETIRLKAEKKARQQGSRAIEESHLKSFLSEATVEKVGGCPHDHQAESADHAETGDLPWTEEAVEKMNRIPQGFMRDLTRQRVNVFAKKKGYEEITPAVINEKYDHWSRGVNKDQTMQWDQTAFARLQRVPDFVKGMVIKEVEQCARANSVTVVTNELMDRASSNWSSSGSFHSEQDPDLYGGTTNGQ